MTTFQKLCLTGGFVAYVGLQVSLYVVQNLSDLSKR